jgi:hypothetical protein
METWRRQSILDVHVVVLIFNDAVNQRDAEYIVECLRVLPARDERGMLVAQSRTTTLKLGEYGRQEINSVSVSDGAIEVFASYLREESQSCHLGSLRLWSTFLLPYFQIRQQNRQKSLHFPS